MKIFNIDFSSHTYTNVHLWLVVHSTEYVNTKLPNMAQEDTEVVNELLLEL